MKQESTAARPEESDTFMTVLDKNKNRRAKGSIASAKGPRLRDENNEPKGYLRSTSGARINIADHFVVDAQGRKTGVLLSIKRYRRLIEDMHDLAVIAERRSEAPISLDELKERLAKDAQE